MRHQTKVDHVIYHSDQWAIMVETGWITHSVDENGIATMYKFC